MLNIFKKENIYSFYHGYNINGKIGFEKDRLSKLGKYDVDYIEENDDFNRLKTLTEDFYKKEPVIIKESDVIYFFKASKYPRFKFSNNCKNLKTIKPDKANYLVTPNVNINSLYSKYYRKQCILANNSNNVFIRPVEGPNLSFLKGLYPIEKDPFVTYLTDRGYIDNEGYQDITLNSGMLRYLNDNQIEVCQALLSDFDKCISESNLEEYVMSGVDTEFTPELEESLQSMLSSTDISTVGLGIKMLNNFVISENVFAISTLLRINGENMARSPVSKSVGFENVLKELGTSLQMLYATDFKTYYSRIYESASEKDKILIKSLYEKELESLLKQSYESLTCRSPIPTTLTIELN